MYVAVYLDSFLIFQFFMGLFVLSLTNEMMRQRICKRKRIAGALVGSILSVIPLILPVNMYVRIGSIFVFSLGSMIAVVFRIYNMDSFRQVAEKVVICTLLMGGMTLMLLRFVLQGITGGGGMVSVFFATTLSYVILRKIIKRQNTVENLCKVILFGEKALEVQALIDTGNTLTEPISGKPVSVLDKTIFENLFDQKPELYRAIPYHSVGKKSGILQGYLMKRMIVETKEGKKEYEGVYVGISEELTTKAGTYKMILNPRVIE